jgi:two-component system sporulation sensor kinase A
LDCYYFPYAKNIVGTLFRDVTGRKNLEKELQSKERLAAIGATAGMVGHDIRNPLQAIASDVYLAKSDLSSMPEGESKEGLKESLDGIDKNVEYINKIVQDLQDYARPLNPKIEDSDLKQVAEGVLAKNGIPRNVEVEVDIQKSAKVVKADAYYLNRILYNLVTNAVQAMPNGGKLTIQARKDRKDTVLSVGDNGVGIPEDIRSKMFTLMFTTKSKGQGFGLPVVKRMVESLGGTVTFESEVGKGTTFIVRLPPPKELNGKLVY